MVAAAILFAIAALGGAVMAALRLGGREFPPIWIAIPHGLAAAAGLITLMITVAGGAAPTTATVAMAGFIIALLGGITLISYHMNRRPLPIPLMLAHGAAAVVSFIILLIAIFSR